VFDRLAAAYHLFGLIQNQSGILASKPVYEWIVRNVDAATPLVMPLVWAVTNLTHQRAEYFFLDPQSRDAQLQERITYSLRITLGPQTIVREVQPELLHRALFASAAIPVAFDPVLMPGLDGEINAYCDGGVASNSPVGIAHALARAADVVFLNPPFVPEESYGDAVAVVAGALGTVDRKLLEVEMRNAYFQSVGKQLLDRLTPTELLRLTQGDTELLRHLQSITPTQLRYIRPQKVLPVDVLGFDDAVGIGEAYRIGWEDAQRGFTAYDWETFAL
jgi:hypothetical protein